MSDPCKPAIQLQAAMTRLGRWAACNEAGATFATFGEIRVVDLFGTAAEYRAGETPEVSVHARWIRYPRAKRWLFVEATVYRAAYRNDDDTDEAYSDTVHITWPALHGIALAVDPGAEFTEVTHYL